MGDVGLDAQHVSHNKENHNAPPKTGRKKPLPLLLFLIN